MKQVFVMCLCKIRWSVVGLSPGRIGPGGFPLAWPDILVSGLNENGLYLFDYRIINYIDKTLKSTTVFPIQMFNYLNFEKY